MFLANRIIQFANPHSRLRRDTLNSVSEQIYNKATTAARNSQEQAVMGEFLEAARHMSDTIKPLRDASDVPDLDESALKQAAAKTAEALSLLRQPGVHISTTLLRQRINAMYQQTNLNFLEEIAGVLRAPDTALYSIDTKVADAIDKMVATPADTLQKAFPHARLPGRNTWFEFSFADEPNRVCGTLVSEFEKDGERTLRVRDIEYDTNMSPFPMYYPQYDTYWSKHEHGFCSTQQDASVLYDIGTTQRIGAKMAVIALLLYNSRSGVVKTDNDPVDDPEMGASRRSRGGDGPARLTPITFDISRVMSKGHADTEEAARVLRYNRLRTGHFKVRETGIFFWGPHNMRVTRAAMPGEAPAPLPAVVHEPTDRVLAKKSPGPQVTVDGTMILTP